MANLAQRRTSSLARRGDVSGEVREFLAFALAGERYGVELARIREIVSPPPITEVPRAPREVIGICSVRGLLVTVLDTRRRMRLEERPPSRLTRILLANVEGGEVIGLLVDEVNQVVRLRDHEIEFAQSVLGGDTSDPVQAIGRPSGDLIVLLDLNALTSF